MELQEHKKWVKRNEPIIQSFIDLYGYDAFQVAAFYGAWADGLYPYIHPYPELKKTPLFSIMQMTACNCFV